MQWLSVILSPEMDDESLNRGNTSPWSASVKPLKSNRKNGERALSYKVQPKIFCGQKSGCIEGWTVVYVDADGESVSNLK